MLTSALELVAVIAALVAVGAAVASVFIVRRGADHELQADVNDLSKLVERISKDLRSDRMRAVRRGQKVGTNETEPMEIPPGAEGIALPADAPVPNSKEELRRRVLAARRISG